MITVDQWRQERCRCCKHGPESCQFKLYPTFGYSDCLRFESKRKPHSHLAGYIAECRNSYSGDWNVIYDAKEQGIDDADGRYACVCEAHGTIVNCTNLPQARAAIKACDWCEECMAEAIT